MRELNANLVNNEFEFISSLEWVKFHKAQKRELVHVGLARKVNLFLLFHRNCELWLGKSRYIARLSTSMEMLLVDNCNILYKMINYLNNRT